MRDAAAAAPPLATFREILGRTFKTNGYFKCELSEATI